MVRIIIALLFCFPAVAFAQTYQQLSERAIECIEKDSLPKACHIQPDWLLIYRIEGDVLVLTLSRTGTHSDLFGK